jgi:ferritin-like metal-binding protein YciE
MIEEEADPEVKDAGLISAAQRVEHYEIAGYGTVRMYAELLGDKEGAKLLQTTHFKRKKKQTAGISLTGKFTLMPQ